MAGLTVALLEQVIHLPAQIVDMRLAAEISAIVTLARHFVQLLQSRDPLSENVRRGKLGVAAFGALGAAKVLFGRTLFGRTLSARSGPAPGAVSGPADERRHTR